MTTLLFVLGALLLAAAVATLVHHQRVLSQRARLMREAVHNRDFTFRLPTKGLLPGEKALQTCLNDMGGEVQQLLARSEVESWQRLTRVLTHEIMNAVTPIASISQTYLSAKDIAGSPYEEGIRAINLASQQLSAFVGSYRKLTCLQQPVPEQVTLTECVEKAASIYPAIAFQIAIPPDLSVRTDRSLLLQVLTNILKNATEAGATKVDIRWTGALLISNDGEPLPPQVRQDIFVPFFTTKPSGSGIGLSLSRQILTMQGHDLTIAPTPVAGYSVTFVIAL